MTCIRSTSGRITTTGTGLPDPGNDFQFAVWHKVDDYSGASTQVLAWYIESGIFNFIGIDEEAAGTLDAYVYINANPPADIATLSTGSSTGWRWTTIRHVGGTTNYDVRSRPEGGSSFDVSATLTRGTEADNVTTFSLPCSELGPVSTRLRYFWLRSSTLNDADSLTASSSFSPPAGTNETVLELDDHTIAGDNLGTGADWGVTGTLTTEADEPDPSISGGGGGGVTTDAFRARAPRSLLGVGFKRQGAIWAPPGVCA